MTTRKHRFMGPAPRPPEQSAFDDARAADPAAAALDPLPSAEEPLAHPTATPHRRAALLRLQRTRGNDAVTESLHEREADRLSEQAASLDGPVRLHGGAEGDAVTSALNADAVTVGADVYLGADAGREEAQALLGHELVHVAQQTGAELRADDGGTVGVTQAPKSVQRQGRAVLDAAYGLFTGDATDFDAASGNYVLSPWDMARLRRTRGFYVIGGTDATYLVMPPEIRRAGGGRAVLLRLGADDVAELDAAPDPAAQVRMLAASRLGVQVTAVTTATGPDRDFATPALPEPVAAALREERPRIAGATGVRQAAAATPQATTVATAEAGALELPMEELEEMDPGRLSAMSDPARAQWAVARLGRFQAQLYESAQRNNIPMQLLAVIILNELGDINWADLLQQGPAQLGGSVGIAQIQVRTALEHGLVDVEPGAAARAAQRALAASGRHMHGEIPPQFARAALVAQRLQVPQYAIEAAAREIAFILRRMAANHDRPWQASHNFTASGPEGDATYDHVGSGPRIARETTLARMVAAAYNSPDIVITSDPSEERYPNARAHGDNAASLAGDLYLFGLFRTRVAAAVP